MHISKLDVQITNLDFENAHFRNTKFMTFVIEFMVSQIELLLSVIQFLVYTYQKFELFICTYIRKSEFLTSTIELCKNQKLLIK